MRTEREKKAAMLFIQIGSKVYCGSLLFSFFFNKNTHIRIWYLWKFSVIRYSVFFSIGGIFNKFEREITNKNLLDNPFFAK